MRFNFEVTTSFMIRLLVMSEVVSAQAGDKACPTAHQYNSTFSIWSSYWTDKCFGPKSPQASTVDHVYDWDTWVAGQNYSYPNHGYPPTNSFNTLMYTGLGAGLFDNADAKEYRGVLQFKGENGQLVTAPEGLAVAEFCFGLGSANYIDIQTHQKQGVCGGLSETWAWDSTFIAFCYSYYPYLRFDPNACSWQGYAIAANPQSLTYTAHDFDNFETASVSVITPNFACGKATLTFHAKLGWNVFDNLLKTAYGSDGLYWKQMDRNFYWCGRNCDYTTFPNEITRETMYPWQGPDKHQYLSGEQVWQYTGLNTVSYTYCTKNSKDAWTLHSDAEVTSSSPPDGWEFGSQNGYNHSRQIMIRQCDEGYFTAYLKYSWKNNEFQSTKLTAYLNCSMYQFRYSDIFQPQFDNPAPSYFYMQREVMLVNSTIIGSAPTWNTNAYFANDNVCCQIQIREMCQNDDCSLLWQNGQYGLIFDSATGLLTVDSSQTVDPSIWYGFNIRVSHASKGLATEKVYLLVGRCNGTLSVNPGTLLFRSSGYDESTPSQKKFDVMYIINQVFGDGFITPRCYMANPWKTNTFIITYDAQGTLPLDTDIISIYQTDAQCEPGNGVDCDKSFYINTRYGETTTFDSIFYVFVRASLYETGWISPPVALTIALCQNVLKTNDDINLKKGLGVGTGLLYYLSSIFQVPTPNCPIKVTIAPSSTKVTVDEASFSLQFDASTKSENTTYTLTATSTFAAQHAVVTKQFSFEVCGTEFIGLNDESAFFHFAKEQGIQEIASNVLKTFFVKYDTSRENPSQCVFNDSRLLDAGGNPLTDTRVYFEGQANEGMRTIKVNTAAPFQLNFKLEYITEGGLSAIFDLAVKVCGDETITLKDPTAIPPLFAFYRGEPTEFVLSLTKWIGNITYTSTHPICVMTLTSLWANAEHTIPQATSNSRIYINNTDDIVIDSNSSLGLTSVWALLESTGGIKLAFEIQFEVCTLDIVIDANGENNHLKLTPLYKTYLTNYDLKTWFTPTTDNCPVQVSVIEPGDTNPSDNVFYTDNGVLGVNRTLLRFSERSVEVQAINPAFEKIQTVWAALSYCGSEQVLGQRPHHFNYSRESGNQILPKADLLNSTFFDKFEVNASDPTTKVIPGRCLYNESNLWEVEIEAYFVSDVIYQDKTAPAYQGSYDIVIDTSKPFLPKSFLFHVLTEGFQGSFTQITIEVCGYETLVPKTPQQFPAIFWQGGTFNQMTPNEVFDEFFTYLDPTSLCVFNNFGIYEDQERTTPWPGGKGFYIDSGNLALENSYKVSLTTMYISACSVGGNCSVYGYQFEQCAIDSLISNDPTHPRFLVELQLTSGYRDIFDLKQWFTPRTDNCATAFKLLLADGSAFTGYDYIDLVDGVLRVDDTNAKDEVNFTIRAYNPDETLTTDILFEVEVCGNEIPQNNDQAEGYQVKLLFDKGPDLHVLNPAFLQTFFKKEKAEAPLAQCPFFMSELQSCSIEGCEAWTGGFSVSFNTSEIENGMHPLVVNKSSPLSERQITINYTTLGHKYSQYTTLIEVCGAEIPVLADQGPYTRITNLLNDTDPYIIPNDVYDWFSYSWSTDCVIQNYTLWNDAAFTIPHTEFALFDYLTTNYEFAHNITWNMSVVTSQNWEIYVKGLTRGGIISPPKMFNLTVCAFVFSEIGNSKLQDSPKYKTRSGIGRFDFENFRDWWNPRLGSECDMTWTIDAAQETENDYEKHLNVFDLNDTHIRVNTDAENATFANTTFHLMMNDTYGNHLNMTFWLEICGFEELQLIDRSWHIEMQRPGEYYAWNDYELLFNLTSFGSSCFVDNYTLWQDENASLAWSDEKLFFADDLPTFGLGNYRAVNFSLTNPDRYFVYLKAWTFGDKVVIQPHEVIVCKVIEPNITLSQIGEPFQVYDFAFNESTDVANMGVASFTLQPLFEGWTDNCTWNQVELKNLTTKQVLELDGYVYYYYEPESENQITLNYEYRQSELATVIVDTSTPLPEKFLIVRVYDHFNNFAKFHISIFVCGLETLEVQPHENNFLAIFNTSNPVDNEYHLRVENFTSWIKTINVTTKPSVKCDPVLWEVLNASDNSIVDPRLISLNQSSGLMSIHTMKGFDMNVTLRATLGVGTQQTTDFYVRVCGEEVIRIVENTTLFVLPRVVGQKHLLSNLTQMNNLTEWFNQPFQPCAPFINLTMITETGAEYTSPQLRLNQTGYKIEISTDKGERMKFLLNISTQFVWTTKNVTIEVCGLEKVTVLGNTQIEYLYRASATETLMAFKAVVDKFKSDSTNCPVYRYSISEVLDKPGDLSFKSAVTLSSTAGLTANYAVANTSFAPLQTLYLVACTQGQVCASYQLDFVREDCKSLIITPTGELPLIVDASQSNPQNFTIEKKQYLEFISVDKDFCPLNRFGLSNQNNSALSSSALDGIITLNTKSGLITVDTLRLGALQEKDVAFYVGIGSELSSFGYMIIRLYVNLPLIVIPPPPTPPVNQTEEPDTAVPFQPLPPQPKPAFDPWKIEEPVRPPRKPAPIIPIENVEVLTEKRDEPPKLNLVSLGAKGEVGIEFSQPIILPKSWREKQMSDTNETARRLLEEAEEVVDQLETEENMTLLNSTLPTKFFKFYTLAVGSNERIEIPLQNVQLVSLTSSKIKARLKYQDPSKISLSDQIIRDSLIVEMDPNDIQGENGIMFDPGAENIDENGKVTPFREIQPMVDDALPAQQVLNDATEAMFGIGIIFMALQFVLSYIMGLSTTYFFQFINSQSNYAYLPLLVVNPPGQVRFYMNRLLKVVTFDPINVEFIYYVFPFWFEKVGEANDKPHFTRIAFENRNILLVLSSIWLWLVIFLCTQIVWCFLKPLKNKHQYVKNCQKCVTFPASFKTFFVVFFTEVYLDLLLGGLINCENEQYFYKRNHWGPYGSLTVSDQFTIVFGYFIYAGAIWLPWFVLYILHVKYMTRYAGEFQMHKFDETYKFLYEMTKTSVPGMFQYFFIFLIRKLAYAHLVYFLDDEHMVYFQLLINFFISWLFLLYLAKFKPFLTKFQNGLNFLNEFCYYWTTICYLCFTDFNTRPENKLGMGWLLVLSVYINYFCPNLILMMIGMWPAIKGAFMCQCLKSKEERQRRRLANKLDMHRQEFLQKHGIKLKPTYQLQEDPEDITRAFPRKNQVTPDTFFKYLRNEFTITTTREYYMDKIRTKKRLIPPPEKPDIEGFDLTVVNEEDEQLFTDDYFDTEVKRIVSVEEAEAK